MIAVAPAPMRPRMTLKDDKNPDAPFARWLRDARARRGLTLQALAERAEVSHPRIIQLEKGDRPSRAMVIRLAEALVPDGLREKERENVLDGLRFHALEAAGFLREEEQDRPDAPPLELPESYTDWPVELQDALGYTSDLSPEAQRYIYRLWREQARAHYDIEFRRREAERRLEERERQIEEDRRRQEGS